MSWMKKPEIPQTQPNCTLPVASSSTLGGVKVGTGLTVGTDGTLSSNAQSVAPLAEQVTVLNLVPNRLNYNVDGNNSINIVPSVGQKIYLHFLNKTVSYDLPAISITTNKNLFINVSTGEFRVGFDGPANEIVLLKNQIYAAGVANFENIIIGALLPFLDYKKVKDKEIISPKDYTYVPISGAQLGIQSFSFIGNELWVFDKDTNTSAVYRRDPVTFALIGSAIPHTLGYFNNCDYNSTLDALIVGNGTGTPQYTDNSLRIYYNVSSWSTLPNLSTSTTQYIDVDLNGLNATGNNDAKVQATWGETNWGNNNIVYITTNDGRTFRKLILGKGTNNLGSGTFAPGKASTEFNGTYKILNVWNQFDGGGNVQDTIYYKGAIYNNSKRSLDEKQLILWKQKLLDNGFIEKVKIVIPVYDETTGNPAVVDTGEGITIKDGKIYCGLLGPGYFITMDVPE